MFKRFNYRRPSEGLLPTTFKFLFYWRCSFKISPYRRSSEIFATLRLTEDIPKLSDAVFLRFLHPKVFSIFTPSGVLTTSSFRRRSNFFSCLQPFSRFPATEVFQSFPPTDVILRTLLPTSIQFFFSNLLSKFSPTDVFMRFQPTDVLSKTFRLYLKKVWKKISILV